jgi:hypothetical protein
MTETTTEPFPAMVVLVYLTGNELRVVITSMDELSYAVAAALNRWTRETPR